MTDVDEFISNFIQHRLTETDFSVNKYDPVKAHEYYMRTRKLKGRKKGQDPNKKSYKYTGKVDPRAYRAFNGKPLNKIGKRMEEDETPEVSPNGAKLVSYNGDGLGKATYEDGRVYDAKVGWVKRSPQERRAFEAAKSRTNRIDRAEAKLTQLKAASSKVKDPNKRASTKRRLSAIEELLRRLRA